MKHDWMLHCTGGGAPAPEVGQVAGRQEALGWYRQSAAQGPPPTALDPIEEAASERVPAIPSFPPGWLQGLRAGAG